MALALVGLLASGYYWNILCKDTCSTAKNGVCEDSIIGGCEYGTDCADCYERTFAINNNITVCKYEMGSNDAVQRDINFRAGDAAKPASGLQARHSCVPITCNEYPDPECKGGCADMPKCLPLADADYSDAMGDVDYSFSKSRTIGDGQVALFPDHWLHNKQVGGSADGGQFEDYCNLDELATLKGIKPDVVHTHFDDRKQGVIFRGSASGGFNQYQFDRGLVYQKADRKTFLASHSNGPFLDLTSADYVELPNWMKYKCLLYMEGNDVGSLIFWALGSGSIMLGPETLTAESVIDVRPWHHYIPYKNDFSNFDEITKKYCGNDVKIAAIQKQMNGGDGADVAAAGALQPDSATEALVDTGANPENVPAAQMVAKVLQNAQGLYDWQCDKKIEAQRKYGVIKMFMDATKTGVLHEASKGPIGAAH